MTAAHGSPLTLPPCNPANSILESDLELAVQQDTLDTLQVMETPKGFFIMAQLKWVKGKKWYLTTRRQRHEPRLFKDLKRLNDHLKEVYPSEGFELFRNQDFPPKSTV